jgi:hypothetical protein
MKELVMQAVWQVPGETTRTKVLGKVLHVNHVDNNCVVVVMVGTVHPATDSQRECVYDYAAYIASVGFTGGVAHGAAEVLDGVERDAWTYAADYGTKLNEQEAFAFFNRYTVDSWFGVPGTDGRPYYRS